ncbi:MAG: ChrR family anti-sigma-E factor [Hyphomonadaceae bacterium]
MNPRHHPSHEILTSYASGLAEPGFGLVIGAHVQQCRACQTQVAQFEAASGEALSALPEADVAGDALSRALAKIGVAAPEASSSRPDERPLLQRLPLKSKKWVAPGVWVAAVDTPHAPENRVYVLHVGAGRPTARHAHSGAEFCTVLQGAFSDDSGYYAAGDFAAADGEVQHQPVVEGDEACVCLFATEGRLKAQGMLGRLAFGYADV